jgi:chemotaxis protein methyltransferase CheR
METIDDLTASLKSNPDPAIINDIIEAMTTNETSFFRDVRPFDIFRDEVLPYMLEARSTLKTVKTWVAASSSGQEPYSINMTLKEQGDKLGGWSFPIKATDISREILDHASKGMYSQFEVQRGLPIQMLMKYFTQDGEKWVLNEDMKSNISFDYFNLLEPMTGLGQFDIIFCRNVLIYFDEATKGDVLNRMAAQLAPDGFLFLGGAETVLGITEAFKPIPNKRGLYAKTGSIHLEAEGTTVTTEAPPSSPIASGGLSS